MRDGAAEVLVKNLYRHVDCLAGLIGPRHLNKPASMNAAATYVERQLIECGYAAVRQAYAIGDLEVANICAEIRGTRRADQFVVLGAHYDTVADSPGADDNASAVAVLIEVARMLRSWQPATTVRFAAFACEEKPYHDTFEMGSQVYARQCRERDEQIIGMLCLEMVGYYSNEPGSQKVPPTIPRAFHRLFPPRGDFLAAVGNLRSWRLLRKFRRGFKRAVKLPLFSIALPESVVEIRRSDNSSFWDQGYPALMLTDTSFLRNPNYHQSTDTPDSLDYERMAEVAGGVAAAVKYLGG